MKSVICRHWVGVVAIIASHAAQAQFFPDEYVRPFPGGTATLHFSFSSGWTNAINLSGIAPNTGQLQAIQPAEVQPQQFSMHSKRRVAFP